MIKYYIVTAPSYDFDNAFIVKANNKKEAINIVFKKHFEWRNPEVIEEGYSPYLKQDLEAEKLEKRFSAGNQYIEL